MNAANCVKGKFTGLFVSSIKFLPFTFTASSPPSIHFTLRLLKLDKQAPLSAAPGGYRTLRGSRLQALSWFGISQKFWMVTCNS